MDNAPVETRHVTVVGAGDGAAGTAVATVDLAAMPAGLHRLRVAATAAGLTSRWVEVLLLDGQPLGTAQAARTPDALDPAGDAAAPTDVPFVWQDAVVYQVVLDRFRNGDRSNDRPVVADSLLPPANYHGGDLQGLLDAIEGGYFTDLGVNTLWLSPVYDNPPTSERESPAPHRLYTGYHGYWPARPRPSTSTWATWPCSGGPSTPRTRTACACCWTRRPPRPRLAPLRRRPPGLVRPPRPARRLAQPAPLGRVPPHDVVRALPALLRLHGLARGRRAGRGRRRLVAARDGGRRLPP